MTSKQKKYLLIALTIITAIILLYAFSSHIINKAVSIYNAISDKETIKKFVESYGAWAPVVFILIQIAQVIFAPIPGEATGVIGGYIFGTFLGFIYSTIGLTIGSLISFAIGRFLGKRYIRKLIPVKYIDKFDDLLNSKGIIVIFICFVFPGFPKDILCLFLGLSAALPYKLFLLLASIGRMPGTFLLTLQGAYFSEKLYWHSAIILGVCVVLSYLSYRYRENIYKFLGNKKWK